MFKCSFIYHSLGGIEKEVLQGMQWELKKTNKKNGVAKRTVVSRACFGQQIGWIWHYIPTCKQTLMIQMSPNHHHSHVVAHIPHISAGVSSQLRHLAPI